MQSLYLSDAIAISPNQHKFHRAPSPTCEGALSTAEWIGLCTNCNRLPIAPATGFDVTAFFRAISAMVK
jgi:hypothetical protein